MTARLDPARLAETWAPPSIGGPRWPSDPASGSTTGAHALRRNRARLGGAGGGGRRRHQPFRRAAGGAEEGSGGAGAHSHAGELGGFWGSAAARSKPDASTRPTRRRAHRRHGGAQGPPHGGGQRGRRPRRRLPGGQPRPSAPVAPATCSPAIVAALLCHAPAHQAACAAVWLHGRAPTAGSPGWAPTAACWRVRSPGSCPRCWRRCARTADGFNADTPPRVQSHTRRGHAFPDA